VELGNQDTSSFENFVNSLECPICNSDIHPENAVLEYFARIDTEEAAVHPLAIGGFCNNGIIEVEPGHTCTEGIIQRVNIQVDVEGETAHEGSVESNVRVASPRLWSLEDHDDIDRIDEMEGTQIEPVAGPTLLEEETIVADIVDSSEEDTPQVDFITSVRDPPTQLDEVRFGYHFPVLNPDIQGPPWVELLREGVNSMYRGHGRPALPIFISAFDNAIQRQLRQTMKAHGRSDGAIKDFFERKRGWKDIVKEGLEEMAGERLTTYDVGVYQDFQQVRRKRDIDVVHLARDDNIPEITPSEASEDFQSVLSAILAVYRICRAERHRVSEL
jgi:predicted transcriptional regulator